jgi:hypothetical protein
MDNAINIQARLDICTVASLARAYTREGVLIRSKSDLVWKAMEQLVNLYESKMPIRFTDVYEALTFLDSLGLQLDTSKRTKRQVMSAQVNQNAVSDFGYETFGKKVTKRQIVTTMGDREEYDLAVQAGKMMGLPIISFEEFMENKRGLKKPSDVIKETTNEVDFAAKEKERLAAEKAAYDPGALRAAMVQKAGDVGA